jgi:hypothetical protein
VVLNPPGCPLLISKTDTDQLTAYDLTFFVVVVNTGLHPITFYTIKYWEYSRESRMGSGSVSTAMGVIGSTTPNLGPGETSEAGLGGTSSPQPMDRVEVAVDFVEFADGTRWGPDYSRSAQTLAAMRAGAREAQAYLKGVFQFGGDSGLASAMAAKHLPLEAPKNSKFEWERGFTQGRDAIQRRVRQAMDAGGGDAVARILEQPLDR